MPADSPTKAKLIAAAQAVRKRAYCPNTGISVGAAALDDQGQIHTACNVENNIIAASLCAERILMGTMISQGGKEVKELVLVSDYSPPWPPCGICRQALAEFSSPDLLIHTVNLQGEGNCYTLAELFPHNRDFLEKS